MKYFTTRDMNPKWSLKRLVDSSVFFKCDDSLCLFTQSVCLSILKIWGWEEWHKMQHGPRMKIALDVQTQEMPGSDTPISFFDLTLQTWSMYWQVSLMSLVSFKVNLWFTWPQDLYIGFPTHCFYVWIRKDYLVVMLHMVFILSLNHSVWK